VAYYIRIANPREFRRSLLLSSKKVVGCMQTGKSVLAMREQKRKFLLLLQDQVKELTLLLDRLDKAMPDKQLREEALQEAKRQKILAAQAPPPKLAPEPQPVPVQKPARAPSARIAPKPVPVQPAQVFVPAPAPVPVAAPVPAPKPVPPPKTLSEEERLAQVLAGIESRLSALR
jgi:hypothetical protein